MKTPIARHTRLLLVACAATFCAGVLSGAWAFGRTLPRSVLPLADCTGNCSRYKDLAGTMASIGVQHAPLLLPEFEMATDQCVAVRHPQPEGRHHFVLFPRRDVRHLLELGPDDTPFVLGCFALARELADRHRVDDWYVRTNGPVQQKITYLHFHLVGK